MVLECQQRPGCRVGE
ncbi:hypothetical protein MTR67_043633 [Solanum verrucosum]|uniref:Uncharacterized protein n=1 Tax=Solanum verrucosum TaxID=315347 RepID=A0AAF0URR8_SOLVR|nr:hypothetical protein MTR67_043633 [Solanum verrucosum]